MRDLPSEHLATKATFSAEKAGEPPREPATMNEVRSPFEESPGGKKNYPPYLFWTLSIEETRKTNRSPFIQIEVSFIHSFIHSKKT